MGRVLVGGAIVAFGAFAFGSIRGTAAPVPKGAEKLPPPTEEQLETSADNLKEIGIAFHAYNEQNKFFPNNIYTAKGEPLLSWRVQLLPYLEESDLYEKFRLDQPWDSEHNKKLLAKMPKVFAPVRVKASEGETFYRGFVGKAALFGPEKGANGRGLTVGDITDGVRNTGLVFEAAEPVIWTKPDDLPFEEKKDLPKLGGLFDGEFHVLTCDGSVHRLRKAPPQNELRRLITYGEGTRVDLESLKVKK